MQNSLDEKAAFALRLRQALTRSPKKVTTPTELALQFNLRHKKDSISPQAAQKWLSGHSKPTSDKIATLADWLGVSPQWLKYGISEDRTLASSGRGKTSKTSIIGQNATETEMKILMKLRNMSEHRRDLVLEIVNQFYLEQEIWKDKGL